MAVYIVKRVTKKGPRWHVRYSAGRYQPVTHLGVFETERLAKMRRQAAIEVEGRGGTPQRFAETLDPPPTITVAAAARDWLETLHDLAPSTLRYYRRSVTTLPDELASMPVTAVTYVDVQAWITQLSKRYARGTIDRELTVLRMLLDNAGIRDNPASDKRVRLPRRERSAYRLPTRAEILELHRVLPTRSALLTLLEHTGLRIHEAAALRWIDIDVERDRLLVRESKTAAGRRFVERLPDSPPFPERPKDVDGLVFSSPGAMSLTNGLRIAHQRHGSPLYSAHDLRHLHASRLLHEGTLSPAQIAARLGHANPAITLSIYSHVVPPD